MSSTFSVATCRRVGDWMQTRSYVVERVAHVARCVSAADVTGLADVARAAQRVVAVEDAIVEAGLVNDEAYVLVLHRGRVLTLGASLLATAVPRTPDEPRPSATIVFGPSAVLSIAEEWAHSAPSVVQETLSISAGDQSPYPPHRSPFGAEPLDALTADPARWCRPFAALDEDCNRTLVVRSRRVADMPRHTVTIDSLVPLTATAEVVEWAATLSTGETIPLRAALSRLADFIIGAVGDLSPSVIDDPVSGERFGLAQPLVTSLRLRDVKERLQ